MFLASSIAAVQFIFDSSHKRGFASETIGGLAFFAVALVMAFPLGMAWRSIRKGRKTARVWAIVASLEVLLMATPLVFYRPPHFPWLLEIGLSTLGIAGLVAFGRRDAHAQLPLSPAKPPRVAGDGTSGFLDQLAVFLAVVGYVIGQYQWMRWGHAQHLPFTRGLLFWLLFAAAVLIEITAHELGHVSVGMALGMKLRLLIVGPFQWRVRDGRWTFQFLPTKFLSAGGAAGVVPTNPAQPTYQKIAMIAAGPLASLFTGLIAAAAALSAKGSSYQQAWELLALMATFGLVSFVVNLVPLRPESLYSDGARIYQLLSGGPWADYNQAISVVLSTAVTPLRPRDYDIDAINRAAFSFTQGRHALLLHLLATSYFLDSGMIPQACESSAKAESIYHESAPDIPVELYTAFVFDSAYLRHDAASARIWWDLMETRKPTHLGVDYWLARSALLWIENRPEESRAAWDKTNALAQKLPNAGTYEYDRYCVRLLGAVLDHAPAAP
jgi:Zn-dependent protease